MASLPIKWVVLLVITLQTTALVLVMRYSRTSAAGPPYFASTAVLLTETFKICCVLVTLWLEHGSCARRTLDALRHDVIGRPWDTARLSVPALLYTMQNNLVFVALSNLDAPTFQVSYQLKILVTAVMSILVLKKRIRPLQWLALVILVVGVCLVQLDRTSGSTSADRRGTNYTVGLLAVLTLCCSSGYAGVYFEKLVKYDTPLPLSVRNTQLALFSVPFGAAAVLLNDGAEIARLGFFYGYTRYTWMVIVLQGLGGLAVSATVKYSDNILKGFATSISILLSSLLSWAVLADVELSATFAAGATLVLAATFLYGYTPTTAKPAPQPPQTRPKVE